MLSGSERIISRSKLDHALEVLNFSFTSLTLLGSGGERIIVRTNLDHVLGEVSARGQNLDQERHTTTSLSQPSRLTLGSGSTSSRYAQWQ